MRESLRVLALTATLGVVAWARPVLADVAPPDSCATSSIGQACSNAGPSYDAAGVCVASTCSHPSPDGSTTYACAACELADAAAAPDSGGSGSSSGGGGSSSGGGSGSGKSGCTLSPLARDGATGFGMLALGVGALVLARRRRPR
ncbi:MAG TPA: hypothetical protein VHS09_09460 [Polyangiaceae bacterium]|nr:hypothetical protein [Polyangiaceae bacterium]